MFPSKMRHEAAQQNCASWGRSSRPPFGYFFFGKDAQCGDYGPVSRVRFTEP